MVLVLILMPGLAAGGCKKESPPWQYWGSEYGHVMNAVVVQGPELVIIPGTGESEVSGTGAGHQGQCWPQW